MDADNACIIFGVMFTNDLFHSSKKILIVCCKKTSIEINTTILVKSTKYEIMMTFMRNER